MLKRMVVLLNGFNMLLILSLISIIERQGSQRTRGIVKLVEQNKLPFNKLCRIADPEKPDLWLSSYSHICMLPDLLFSFVSF